MRFEVGTAAVEMIEDGDRQCAHVRDGRGFEPDSLAIWGGLCARGGTALDVGAYTGLYSISAALLGCSVIAFEPMPFNAKRLRLNSEANGVKVDLRQVVASDRSGETFITYNPRVKLTSGASLVGKGGQRIKVRSMAIDDLKLEQVTAIKIDVERAEPLVLAGAVATIERCKPALLVEVLGDVEKAAVLAAVTGYRVEQEIDVRNWLMLPEKAKSRRRRAA
jgi:FkbM family methyltransferase